MNENLPYNNLSDVTFDNNTPINNTTLNVVFGKLLENDLYNCPPATNFPSIWENKWFNDNTISGYAQGDAVWYNTEDLRVFINNNYNKIYNYAINNLYLRPKIKPYILGNVSIYNIYKSIVLGYKDNNISLPPLFDLGNMENQAQIRISKINNNKTLPSNSETWEDFFITSENSTLSSTLSGIISGLFDEHIELYHMGIADETEQNKTAILNKYVSKDLSNISKIQTQTNPNNLTTSTGFDYVKKFVDYKLGPKTHQWFRLWASGLLEHGGVVAVDNSTPSVKMITLAWDYTDAGLHKKAPSYGYTKNSSAFYDVYTKYDIGTDISSANSVNEKTRYTISLTQLTESDIKPYNSSPDETYKNYLVNEVCIINNDSFGFKVTDQTLPLISYYTKGYTTEG